MMNYEDIKKAAAEIYEAGKSGNKIPLLSAKYQLDEAAAYDINEETCKLAKAEGRGTVGIKIALSNEGVQEKFGVSEPAYGYIYSDKAFTSGHEVIVGEGDAYKVECELAFVFKKDMDKAPKNKNELADAIDYMFPALEIVSTRYNEAHTSYPDLIADNSNFYAAVLGDIAKKPDSMDLELVGMRLEVNGKLRTSGISAGVMENPLNALQWLVEKRIGQGKAVKAGEVVMAGSFIPAEAAQAGDYFRASFYKMGDVAVIFKKAEQTE